MGTAQTYLFEIFHFIVLFSWWIFEADNAPAWITWGKFKMNAQLFQSSWNKWAEWGILSSGASSMRQESFWLGPGSSTLWGPRLYLSNLFALIVSVKYTSCFFMIGSLSRMPSFSSLMNSLFFFLNSSIELEALSARALFCLMRLAFCRFNSFVISWYSPRPRVVYLMVFSRILVPTVDEMILPELVDSLVMTR